MPILDHFNVIAPFYDRIFHLPAPEKLINLVGLPISGTLLDAGGGTGRVAQALSGLAASIVVADLSLGMLHQASTKDGLDAVCAHTEKLPFFDDSFDRVIMVDALHHVYSHAKTLQELWRVVKPGGRIVIEEPDICSFPVQMVALAEKMAMMRSHFVTPQEIINSFTYQDARSRIERQGHNVWVIVDKVEG